MIKFKRFILYFILIILPIGVHSQELICNIQIVSSQIQGTNKQIFQTLQQSLYEFINSRVWTNHVFDTKERIECNFLINLKEQIGADEYAGTLQIQAKRPVYNTSYSTILLNYIDNDLHFRYVEFESLEFSETSHISNLTSVMAYYVYIILGIDYDTFSSEGGTPFFEIAEKIVNNAQNAKEKGWRSIDSQSRRNRYWLINSILNPEFSPIREFYYKYHRHGLDKLSERTSETRSNIAEYLKLLQQVHRLKPDPFMHFLQVILDAKSEELANIFSESFDDEKRIVHNLLTEIDPTHKDTYNKIIAN